MASLRGHHRRGSMEEPITMSSDVIHLKEELNRLHKDIIPQCSKQIEKMSDLLNDFNNDLRLVINVLRGAIISGIIGVVFAALSFFVYDDTVSVILGVAGAAMAVVAVLCLAFWKSRTTQQKKLIRATEAVFQNTVNPIIDTIEETWQRTEDILRDPSLSDHNTQALSEHFAYCFEKKLLQEHDGKVDRMSKVEQLSGKLSEMMAMVSSVPDILKEIMEDNKRQRDKPAKPTREQTHKREFKEMADKIIHDTQKGICELKSAVKEINQRVERISNRLSST